MRIDVTQIVQFMAIFGALLSANQISDRLLNSRHVLTLTYFLSANQIFLGCKFQ